MNKRSLIALIVVLAIVVPLALGGIAVLMGGDGSRITGALRLDEYERQYGTDLYLETPTGGQFLGQAKQVTDCGRLAGLSAAADANGVVRKQPSTPAPGPCEIRVSAGRMQPAFSDLLDDVLTGQVGRTGFWLVNLNRTGGVSNGIHIDDALVEASFDALDSDALDEELSIVLKLRPDSVVELPACCGTFVPTRGSVVTGRNTIFKNGYQASISGVAGGQDIVAISAMNIRQVAAGNNVAVELGDLVITVNRHPTNGFRQWFTDFAVNGQSAAANEKTLTLTLKRGTVAGITITFTGVGVRAEEPLGWGSGNVGTVLRDRFTIYVEQATLNEGGPPPPPPAPAPQPQTQTQTQTQTVTSSPPPPPATTSQATTTAPVPTEKTPLAAPLEIKASAEGSAITVAWAPVEGAEYYVVLSSTEPEGRYAELARGEKTEQTVGRFEPGSTVYLVVRSGRGEAQSADSEVITVEIP